MPLFECSRCHSVDNTAMGNFWFTVYHEKLPALCTACDPQIGEWHGQFPRTRYEEYILKYGQNSVEYPSKP